MVLENNGNVFDSLCLGINACFKTLIIPSLNIKNIERYNEENEENKDNLYQSDHESLFKNTEITKKATIFKMRQKQKMRQSKFSGQELPFQDSISLTSSIQNESANHNNKEIQKQKVLQKQPESMDIAEIDFEVEHNKNGKRLNGLEMLPIIVTMATMDKNKYFIIDPLYEEELCCDVIIRIAVYSNGNICIIKYGDKPIDPLLIFNMIESGKQSGQKWMQQMDQYLKKCHILKDIDKHDDKKEKEEKKEEEEEDEEETKDDNDIDDIYDIDNIDLYDLGSFEFNEEDEKQLEIEMTKELENLSFITESLRKEQDDHIYSHQSNQNEQINNKQEMDIDGNNQEDKLSNEDMKQNKNDKNKKENTATVTKVTKPLKIDGSQHNIKNNKENENDAISFLKESSDETDDENTNSDQEMIMVD